MAPRYDVREVQDRGHYWQVVYDLTMDDGTITEHGHSIPKDTFEWRAAEYDLHPANDFESILDIVLAEPYLAEEDRVPGEELYDAPDIATARARHVTRCAKTKLKNRMSTRATVAAAGKGVGASAAPAHPLDVIRTGTVMDETVIAVKREHVRQAREERARQVRERPADREERRAERLAEQLSVDLDAVKSEMRKNRG
jgi:hypothetical protein